MKKLLLGIILVFLLVNIFLITASAQEQNENVLSVSGTYTVVAVADEAYVSIGVKTSNIDYKLCQEENKNKMNDITNAIKALGIEEKYIKTTQYKSIPVYEYIKTDVYTGIYYDGTYYNKRVLKEYQLTHMIRVMLTDVSLVGKLIDISVENGVNELNNVQFSISKSKEYELYLEALKGASKRAKEKAEVISNELGIKTLKVKNVNEVNNIPKINYSYNYAPMADVGGSVMKEDNDTTNITSGELQISATVSIVYTY